MTYIKFNYPSSRENEDGHLKRIIKRTIIFLLGLIFPKANPDFDRVLAKVHDYLIEFDDNGIPNREIGLDNFGKVLFIAPWKRNRGFWVDEDLILIDFQKSFNLVNISKDQFESYWESYVPTGI